MGRTEPFSITIYGTCQSKANGRRAVIIRGRSALIKSKAALAFSKVFEQQCPKLDLMFEQPVHADIDIYYPSRRNDLDESLALDLAQGRLYLNDRQVRSRRTRWGLDKDNPRVVMTIRLMTDEDYAGR